MWPIIARPRRPRRCFLGLAVVATSGARMLLAHRRSRCHAPWGWEEDAPDQRNARNDQTVRHATGRVRRWREKAMPGGARGATAQERAHHHSQAKGRECHGHRILVQVSRTFLDCTIGAVMHSVPRVFCPGLQFLGNVVGAVSHGRCGVGQFVSENRQRFHSWFRTLPFTLDTIVSASGSSPVLAHF